MTHPYQIAPSAQSVQHSGRPNLCIVRNQPNRTFGNSLSESSAEVRPNRTRLIPNLYYLLMQKFVKKKNFFLKSRFFVKIVRERPKLRFGQGSAELSSLSETSVSSLCQKVRPNFGRTESSVYHYLRIYYVELHY